MNHRKIHISVFLFPAMIFLLIGLIFGLIGGIFTLRTHQFLQTAVEASATIVEIREEEAGEDTGHRVYVEFETQDGRHIRTDIDSYSSSMREGNVIPVFYDPEDPIIVRYMVPYRILSVIYSGISLLLLLIGTILLLRWKRKRDRERWLRKNGRHVHAQIVGFRADPSIRLNNRNPVILLCTAQLQGQNRDFQCRNFFRAPEQLIGKYATVYYDPTDPSTYVVEAPDGI